MHDIIDSHCHLEMSAFDADRDAAVDRAVAAGVTRMISVATNLSDAGKALAFARSRPEVFVALGLHPHDARTWTDEIEQGFVTLAADPKVVAWGEIGLDYHYDHSPRDVQRRVFARQIALARGLDLPIAIHSREAGEDTLAVLEAEGREYRGVFHCFGGDVDFARRVLALGFQLSFTGTITFKNAGVSHDVIRFAGPDRLLVETDSPYLTPVPYRGKRNEPAHTALVARAMAQVLGCAEESLRDRTRENTLTLFPRMRPAT